ncbi:hypothetical protein ACHAXT_007651 [Thalassiosira profunda]
MSLSSEPYVWKSIRAKDFMPAGSALVSAALCNVTSSTLSLSANTGGAVLASEPVGSLGQGCAKLADFLFQKLVLLLQLLSSLSSIVYLVLQCLHFVLVQMQLFLARLVPRLVFLVEAEDLLDFVRLCLDPGLVQIVLSLQQIKLRGDLLRGGIVAPALSSVVKRGQFEGLQLRLCGIEAEL